TKETNEIMAQMAEHQKGRVVSEAQKEKQRKDMTGRKSSQETKDKIRAALTGKKKTAIHVANVMKNSGVKRLLYTKIDGRIVKMRSNWERVYAKHLGSLGIIWEYEPKGFVLSDVHRYFPDFFICQN
ncbi:MAG: hypothetical protein AABX79_00050, partial [Nanoarchaeota archaeon]